MNVIVVGIVKLAESELAFQCLRFAQGRWSCNLDVAVAIDLVAAGLACQVSALSSSKAVGAIHRRISKHTLNFLIIAVLTFHLQSLLDHLPVSLLLLAHLMLEIVFELCHFLVKSLVDSSFNNSPD